jgi:predicted  nucleic acid-binding Zn-ribbon protein
MDLAFPYLGLGEGWIAVTNRLEVWGCPECGSPSYYWHYEDDDGTAQIARLPSLPDSSPSAIQAAIAADRRKRERGTA